MSETYFTSLFCLIYSWTISHLFIPIFQKLMFKNGFNECSKEETSISKRTAFINAQAKATNSKSEKENRLTSGKISFYLNYYVYINIDNIIIALIHIYCNF